MRKVYTPPPLERGSTISLAIALAMTVAIFLILPFTQLFSSVKREILLLRPVEISLPPPPPPPKQPPPEEKEPEKKPELKEKPKPLTLSQLEIVLNPGTGGALEMADLSLRDFGVAADTVAEMKIFQLSEVDREPQLIYQAEVNYPLKLLRDRIGGFVLLLFYVDEKGNVREVRVKKSTGQPELERAAMDAVAKYRFTPGMKDGQAVRTWFEIPITFAPPQ